MSFVLTRSSVYMVLHGPDALDGSRPVNRALSGGLRSHLRFGSYKTLQDPSLPLRSAAGRRGGGRAGGQEKQQLRTCAVSTESNSTKIEPLKSLEAMWRRRRTAFTAPCSAKKAVRAARVALCCAQHITRGEGEGGQTT